MCPLMGRHRQTKQENPGPDGHFKGGQEDDESPDMVNAPFEGIFHLARPDQVSFGETSTLASSFVIQEEQEQTDNHLRPWRPD